jgi:hypothetical protein
VSDDVFLKVTQAAKEAREVESARAGRISGQVEETRLRKIDLDRTQSHFKLALMQLEADHCRRELADLLHCDEADIEVIGRAFFQTPVRESHIGLSSSPDTPPRFALGRFKGWQTRFAPYFFRSGDWFFCCDPQSGLVRLGSDLNASYWPQSIPFGIGSAGRANHKWAVVGVETPDIPLQSRSLFRSRPPRNVPTTVMVYGRSRPAQHIGEYRRPILRFHKFASTSELAGIMSEWSNDLLIDPAEILKNITNSGPSGRERAAVNDAGHFFFPLDVSVFSDRMTDFIGTIPQKSRPRRSELVDEPNLYVSLL